MLTAALLTEALRDRLAVPGGRLLFLSSIAAYRGSGTGAYAAAKAGCTRTPTTWPGSWGRAGITVNVVAPGYIEDTAFFGGDGLDAGAAGPARRRDLGQAAPGRPGDVAATLHWLASHGAGHITSQIIQVNGVRSAG